MIHVRLVSPPTVTPELVPVLASERAVFNLMVLPAAVRNPDGDSIQFDLLQGRANEVIERVRATGIDQHGSISLDPVAASISAAATHTMVDQSRFDEFAPVWEEVDARIRSGGRFPPSWYLLLVIAGLIAAVGLLTNSQILIVGAMVVGPEYGAVVALAYASIRHKGPAVRRSAVALTVGFALAAVAPLFLALMTRAAGLEPRAFAIGLRPVSDLINTPGWFSVIVATLAGIVGVISLTEARTGTLIGVFTSLTHPGADTACRRARQRPGSPGFSRAALLERDNPRSGRGRRYSGPAGALGPDVPGARR